MTGLYPYQVDGVKHIAERSWSMLGDEPGLGKTGQAIVGVMDAWDARGEQTPAAVLVIVPASLRHNWRNEILKWWPHTGMTGTPRIYMDTDGVAFDDALSSVKRGIMTDPVFLIVSYDMLSHAKLDLTLPSKRQWSSLILDEAHYLKNHASNRTKAVFGNLRSRKNSGGIAGQAKHVVELTGTPAPNHAGELWTHLAAALSDVMEEQGVRALFDFESRYCLVRETAFGRQIVGSQNTKELKTRFLDGWLLRRRKKDVLPYLPPLSFQTVPLQIKASDAKTLDGVMRAQLGLAAGDVDPDDVVRALRRAGTMPTEARLTGEVKADAALDFIRNELDGNHRKIIVFAWHKSVIRRLREGLASFNPVQVAGETNAQQTADAVDAFQTDPNTRVFIGQIKSAGTGLTLTASSQVVFVEQSWTPSDNYQAACRAHRIGQNDGVLAQVLTMPGTIDDIIGTVLARKAQDIADLFG